jgi:hypothetical protein
MRSPYPPQTGGWVGRIECYLGIEARPTTVTQWNRDWRETDGAQERVADPHCFQRLTSGEAVLWSMKYGAQFLGADVAGIKKADRQRAPCPINRRGAC